MPRPTCLTLLVSLILGDGVSRPASAEWNPTPIAIPLLNADMVAPGPAAPYP